MEITRGRINRAKKVVIYGPEGIGKSTFASKFPDAVFIDTEGSTSSMDVARLPRPTSWTLLLEEIDYIKNTQVGAFGNEKNAEKLAAELKAKGYSVVIKQY